MSFTCIDDLSERRLTVLCPRYPQHRIARISPEIPVQISEEHETLGMHTPLFYFLPHWHEGCPTAARAIPFDFITAHVLPHRMNFRIAVNVQQARRLHFIQTGLFFTL